MIDRRRFVAFTAAAVAAWPAWRVTMARDGSADRLPSRPIPGTGEPLPVVGLGNARAFKSGDVQRSREVLDVFLAHGGAYVDVSGPARYTVAGIVREKAARDRTFLGSYIDSREVEPVRREIAALQAAQGGGALDLLLARDPAWYMNHGDIFRRMKDQGLARYTGIARSRQAFFQPIMDLMGAGAVDFVQINYSLLEPEAEQRLLPMARDKGIAVVINRPFANGDWFPIVRGRKLPDWAADFDCESWAQFSLKFILSHPAVNCVLTETSNPAHVLDNVRGGMGRLPDEKTRQRMRALINDLT